MECASMTTRPLANGRNVLNRGSQLGTPLGHSDCAFKKPLAPIYTRRTGRVSAAKNVSAKGTEATGGTPGNERAEKPTPTSGVKRSSHVAPVKAVAVATETAPPTPAPLKKTKIQLTVVTGMEGDAGMNGDANVTFVAKNGDRYPPSPSPGILIRGPFKNDAKKPPSFDMELPPGFDVAGIIVYNPKDDQIPRRVLAWLADRLNIKIPFFNGNVLNFLTRKTNLQGLTNGDWYVSRLEIVNKEGGGYSTFDTGNRPPGTEGIDKVFPLYGWIRETTTRIAFEGTAYLPQDTPTGLLNWRRRTLITNQNAYNFQPYNDLSKPPNNDDSQSPNYRPVLDPYPQHIQSDRAGPNAGVIPRDEQFGLSKRTDFNTGTVSGLLNALAALIYDPQIFPSIGRALLIGLGAGFLVGYLAESGASEAFLDSVDELRPAFIPRELEQALAGAIPAAILAGVIGGQVLGAETFGRTVVPGGIGGTLVGLLTGEFGALPAGIVGGLLATVAVVIGILKNDLPKLSYDSVEAYSKACFGRQYRVPLTNIEIGYKRPFVYQLGLEDPKKDWKTDFMFGWQTVAGINPESIQLVKKESDLTKSGTITAEDLKKVKAEFPGFAQELKDSKVFMLDFSVLEGFREEVNKNYGKNGKQMYLYAPVVILHQDDKASHGVPIPIAIKLSKGEEQIITPGGDKSEEKWGWTLAKAMAASANSGVHQLVQHWLRTHAVCETYGIAIRRQLSEAHPLFKLLIPHTRYTMDINNRARQSLINTDGVIESNFTPGQYAMRVSAAGYRGWRFENQDPSKDLEVRGVLDEDTLPNYPYRAHALEVWAALQEYTKNYVDLYYKGEEDIAFDFELRAFWNDVKRAHSSLDTWLNMNDPDHKDGLDWPELKTKSDLAHILAIMIWAGSAMHSTVNFGQYDYSGFVPNAPASIRQKFDYSKLNGGIYTEKDFMAAMPTAFEMTTVMTVVQSLVIHSVEEQYLGLKQDPSDPSWKFADPWLTDTKAVAVYNKFVDRIDKAQEKLEKLNDKAVVPYYYLLPHPLAADYEKNIPAQGVPNSVTI